MLSVSYEYDSVNERTREISESMKLHSKGVAKCPQNVLATMGRRSYRHGFSTKGHKTLLTRETDTV